MAFSKARSKYQEDRANADEVWIKNLRDGETRLRLLIEPLSDDVKTYREHFEEGVGYYPCNDEADCVGCNSESERVRNRQRRFVYHCVDKDGRLQLYKFGSKLQDKLERKEQRLGSCTDRDYNFIRSGKGLGTDYDAEPLQAYPLENPPTTRYDIEGMLEDKYAQAVAAYKGEDPPAPRTHELPSDEGAPESKPLNTSKAAAPAADEAQAAPSGDPWDAPPDGGQQESPPDGDPDDPLARRNVTPDKVPSMQSDDIRKFMLRHAQQEFPQRIPRSKLVASAQAWITKNPPF